MALIIFFGARAELFGSEFLFWSLSRSLKFWEPTRALVGSLKFLLVSQDPFIGLVIADFSPLVPQETILISHQEKAGGGDVTGMSSSTLVVVECASDITNVMLW